jgi:rhomboid protease GluP
MNESPRRQYAIPLTKPIVTWVILCINVAIWLAMTLVGGSDNTAVLVQFGAKVNALIVLGEYWRLLASCFLHIGIVHLAFNTYALYVLGNEVEAFYGRVRFTIIYLLAGLFGSLVSFALNPGLSAGSSGAIFGLIGTLAAFYWRQREAFGPIARRRFANMIMVVALNVFIGLTTPGIDNFAHLGGLVAGLILGWQLAPRYEVAPQPDGSFGVVDRNGLRRQWWAVLLSAALFAWCAVLFVNQQADSSDVHVFLGRQALENGQATQAQAEFQVAVERDPGSARAHFGLGNAYYELGDYESAAAAYRRTLELAPDWIEAHWNLALCYARLGRTSEAIAAMRAYIDADPGPDEVRKARELIAQWSRQ